MRACKAPGAWSAVLLPLLQTGQGHECGVALLPGSSRLTLAGQGLRAGVQGPGSRLRLASQCGQLGVGLAPFICALCSLLPTLTLRHRSTRETALPFVSPPFRAHGRPALTAPQHSRPLLYPQYPAPKSGVCRETPTSYSPQLTQRPLPVHARAFLTDHITRPLRQALLSPAGKGSPGLVLELGEGLSCQSSH